MVGLGDAMSVPGAFAKTTAEHGRRLDLDKLPGLVDGPICSVTYLLGMSRDRPG